MFAIDFDPGAPGEVLFGERARYAIIRLDDFTDRLAVPLVYWTAADYRRQWREAVRRTVEGHPRSALITSMREPTSANFIQWWPLYRVDQTVFVQHQILFMDTIPGPFRPDDWYEHVHDRRTCNEDGERLSEWRVSVGDLQAFLSGTAQSWT